LDEIRNSREERNKMSQEIDLCQDSDDNGEWSNTASIPSLPRSSKRLRNKKEACNDTHPHIEDDPGNKTATGSAESVVDMELADQVEVSPHRKRRGDMKDEPSAKNDVAGKCGQVLEGVHTTEKDVGALEDRFRATWNDRLSELAEYRKIHGHCNVPQYRKIHGHCNGPQRSSENTKLSRWVERQRGNYWVHREGKASPMTAFRIQELESLGFEWRVCVTTWGDSLNELAEYRKIHGHCNVLRKDDSKVSRWVERQRYQYRLQQEGKISQMTLSRIQALESLGLEWNPSISRKGTPNKPSLGDDKTRVRERAKKSPEHMQKVPAVETSTASKLTSLSNPKKPPAMAKSTPTLSWVEPKKRKRVEDTCYVETDLHASPSESAAKSSLYSDCQAANSPTLDKSALAGESVELYTRKDASEVNQQKSINSFSHDLLVPGPPSESSLLIAAKKPANLRTGEESQLETSRSNEMLWANPVVAEPMQQKHNLLTHALLLGEGSTGDEIPTDAPEDMQQMPQDEVFQSDNVLNEVELELIWLGEESMYCLSSPEFQFDFIYEYASPALKVELRKLSRDDQSETEKVKEIVRVDEWLVFRRFDFVRKYIRNMLRRGFRRERMRTVIAEVRLLRREQPGRHYPAMILNRSETASVKASTMIEQVDANTLQAVATFSSQSEAERQTGIPRTNISRSLRQGRPLGGYFWRSARL
jgi:hypothetical protein